LGYAFNSFWSGFFTVEDEIRLMGCHLLLLGQHGQYPDIRSRYKAEYNQHHFCSDVKPYLETKRKSYKNKGMDFGFTPCALDGLKVVFCSFLFFRFLALVVLKPFVNFALSGFYSKLSREKFLIWNNLAISYVHAWVSACLSVYLFYSHPEVVDDMIHSQNSLAKLALQISTGYFFADQFDMMYHRLFLKVTSLYIHHCVVLVAFTTAVISCEFGPYMVSTLIVEVNGVFLQQRGLYIQAGNDKSHFFFKVNLFFLMLTFFPFRVIPHMWLVYKVVQDYNTFPSIYSWCIAFGGMCLMNYLNADLFWNLIKSDLLSSKKDKKIEPAGKVHENGKENGKENGQYQNGNGNHQNGKECLENGNNQSNGHGKKEKSN